MFKFEIFTNFQELSFYSHPTFQVHLLGLLRQHIQRSRIISGTFPIARALLAASALGCHCGSWWRSEGPAHGGNFPRVGDNDIPTLSCALRQILHNPSICRLCMGSGGIVDAWLLHRSEIHCFYRSGYRANCSGAHGYVFCWSRHFEPPRRMP